MRWVLALLILASSCFADPGIDSPNNFRFIKPVYGRNSTWLGTVTADRFVGDGSGLTGISGTSGGISPSWYDLSRIPTPVQAVSNGTYTAPTASAMSWYGLVNTPAQVAAVSNSGSINMAEVSATRLYGGSISGTTGTFGSIGVGNINASGQITATTLTVGTVSTSGGGTVSATNGYFGNISGSGVGLTSLPVFETVSLSIVTPDSNFTVTGMTPAAQTQTLLTISPLSTTVISGINASGVADGKELCVRNATSPVGAGGRLLMFERESPLAAYPLSYSPMPTPIMLMPQYEACWRFSVADSKWSYTGGNRTANPAQMFDEFNDFGITANAGLFYNNGTNAAGFTGTNSNSTSATVWIAGTENGTGTTSTGRAYYGMGPNQMILGRGAALYFGRHYPFQLPTGAQQFKAWVGFGNASAAAMPTAGCLWALNPSATTTPGNYQIAAFNNAGSTSMTTALTASITQPAKLGVFINPTGTSCEFFHSTSDSIVIDDTINSNIPTTSSNPVGVQTGLTKNNGGTSVFWETEFFGWAYQVIRGQ